MLLSCKCNIQYHRQPQSIYSMSATLPTGHLRFHFDSVLVYASIDVLLSTNFTNYYIYFLY